MKLPFPSPIRERRGDGMVGVILKAPIGRGGGRISFYFLSFLLSPLFFLNKKESCLAGNRARGRAPKRKEATGGERNRQEAGRRERAREEKGKENIQI